LESTQAELRAAKTAALQADSNAVFIFEKKKNLNSIFNIILKQKYRIQLLNQHNKFVLF